MENQKVIAGLNEHHEIVTFVVDFICSSKIKIQYFFTLIFKFNFFKEWFKSIELNSSFISCSLDKTIKIWKDFKCLET